LGNVAKSHGVLRGIVLEMSWTGLGLGRPSFGELMLKIMFTLKQHQGCHYHYHHPLKIFALHSTHPIHSYLELCSTNGWCCLIYDYGQVI